jgi:hypothetical protein
MRTCTYTYIHTQYIIYIHIHTYIHIHNNTYNTHYTQYMHTCTVSASCCVEDAPTRVEVTAFYIWVYGFNRCSRVRVSGSGCVSVSGSSSGSGSGFNRYFSIEQSGFNRFRGIEEEVLIGVCHIEEVGLIRRCKKNIAKKGYVYGFNKN